MKSLSSFLRGGAIFGGVGIAILFGLIVGTGQTQFDEKSNGSVGIEGDQKGEKSKGLRNRGADINLDTPSLWRGSAMTPHERSVVEEGLRHQGVRYVHGIMSDSRLEKEEQILRVVDALVLWTAQDSGAVKAFLSSEEDPAIIQLFVDRLATDRPGLAEGMLDEVRDASIRRRCLAVIARTFEGGEWEEGVSWALRTRKEGESIYCLESVIPFIMKDINVSQDSRDVENLFGKIGALLSSSPKIGKYLGKGLGSDMNAGEMAAALENGTVFDSPEVIASYLSARVNRVPEEARELELIMNERDLPDETQVRIVRHFAHALIESDPTGAVDWLAGISTDEPYREFAYSSVFRTWASRETNGLADHIETISDNWERDIAVESMARHLVSLGALDEAEEWVRLIADEGKLMEVSKELSKKAPTEGL